MKINEEATMTEKMLNLKKTSNVTDNRNVHQDYTAAYFLFRNFLGNKGDCSVLEQLRELAEEGNRWAGFYLSVCYQNGVTDDHSNDRKKAQEWLEKTKDLPIAQYELAMLYFDNNDIDSGKKYIKKAAKGGVVDALYMLGVYYAEGYLFKQNILKAEKYLDMARKMGHPNAYRGLKQLK